MGGGRGEGLGWLSRRDRSTAKAANLFQSIESSGPIVVEEQEELEGSSRDVIVGWVVIRETFAGGTIYDGRWGTTKVLGVISANTKPSERIHILVQLLDSPNLSYWSTKSTKITKRSQGWPFFWQTDSEGRDWIIDHNLAGLE